MVQKNEESDGCWLTCGPELDFRNLEVGLA